MFKIISIVIVFLCLSGCGTITSQSHKIDFENLQTINDVHIGPLSGVVYDAKWIKEKPIYTPLLLIDMPISLVADIIILPYTIYRANEKCSFLKCNP